jgi:dolichol-phosphate mannosyltransferase
MNTLTAIVPFFNEEKYLNDSVENLLKIDVITEIFLVDDCSTDKSNDIAKNIVKKNKKVKLFTKDINDGKGSCLKEVSTEIMTTHVIIHDADLEYFPDDIFEMFKKTLDYTDSLILGSRFIGSKTRINIYKRTYFANKIMSLFFSLFNFYKITDVATCYKLMPASFFTQTTFKEKGFSIEIELLSKFLKINRSIVEVPIRYRGRSYTEGKKIKATDGFRYLINTIKYRFTN